MVAKINRGASLYGAIIYNLQKVNDNTARIIYGNRMIANVSGNTERVMQQTLWAFDNYLLANKNTEKPVLHISLNLLWTTGSRICNSRNWPGSICSEWAMATSLTLYICTRT